MKKMALFVRMIRSFIVGLFCLFGITLNVLAGDFEKQAQTEFKALCEEKCFNRDQRVKKLFAAAIDQGHLYWCEKVYTQFKNEKGKPLIVITPADFIKVIEVIRHQEGKRLEQYKQVFVFLAQKMSWDRVTLGEINDYLIRTLRRHENICGAVATLCKCLDVLRKKAKQQIQNLTIHEKLIDQCYEEIEYCDEIQVKLEEKINRKKEKRCKNSPKDTEENRGFRRKERPCRYKSKYLF
ncbi:MAG: hypothetical protein V1855_03730 [bacterium]